jgi:hypothetical protein
MESGRAPIWRWMGKWHGLVHCLAALAEVQALSAFLVLHAEPQSCARAGERRTVAFHFNGAMLATMYLREWYSKHATTPEVGMSRPAYLPRRINSHTHLDYLLLAWQMRINVNASQKRSFDEQIGRGRTLPFMLPSEIGRAHV